MKTHLVHLFSLALFLLVISCGGQNPPKASTVKVTVSPSQITLTPAGIQSFTATVTGTTNNEVTWQTSAGHVEGESTTITYLAPAQPGEYTLTATSVEDPGQAATATVTVGASQDTRAHIEIISDLSAVLTAPGDEATFVAAVYKEDGSVDTSARITWRSSDPATVAIAEDGTVTAQTDLGSAIITASYKNYRSATASALVAKLTPQTILIPSALVSSRDETSSVLEQTTLTETLAAGQVLLSGSDAGVLLKVTNVQSNGTQVRIQGEPATLTDAFSALDVKVTGEPVHVLAQLGDATKRSTTAANSHNIAVQLNRDDLKCDSRAGGAFDVDKLSPDLSFDTTLTPYLAIRISPGVGLEQLTFGTEAVLGFGVYTGSISVTSSGSFMLHCAVDIDPYQSPAISVSVLSFALAIDPELGLDVEATVDGPSLVFEGPSGSVGGTALAGIDYSRSRGWRPLKKLDWDGNFNTITAYLDTDVGFSASDKPYGNLTSNLVVTLGRKIFGQQVGLSLADVKFFEANVAGRLNAALPKPLDPAKAAYRGPNWNTGLSISGELEADLTGGALAKLLERLGIPTGFEGALELFNIDKVLAHSPKPTVETSAEAIKVGQAVTFTGPADTDNLGFVGFWATKNGAARLTLLTDDVFANGSGKAVWQTKPGDEGKYTVYPRLRTCLKTGIRKRLGKAEV